jgi:CheY-like chemotaxis protein
MSGADSGRILVVDDVLANVRLLEAMLVPREQDVVPATGGRAALEPAGSAEPDLVLLDVMMPGLGYATCGEIGFDGRSDYAAIGAVTNLASRLADEATGGQVLLGQRLYAEVEGDVEVVAVGELTLKGSQGPVAAFNVLAVSETIAEPLPL